MEMSDYKLFYKIILHL